MKKKGLVWIRRDIRLHDHAALAASLSENEITYLVFIFDTNILDPLSKKSDSDRRVQFISESLLEIAKELQKNNSGLIIIKGEPIKEIPKIAKSLSVSTLYFNRDYSPYTMNRDDSVIKSVENMGVGVKTYKVELTPLDQEKNTLKNLM